VWRILGSFARQSSTKVDTYQSLNTLALHYMNTLHQARTSLT